MSNKNEADAVTEICDAIIARSALQETATVGAVEFVPADDGSSDFVFDTQLVFAATIGDRPALYRQSRHFYDYLVALFTEIECSVAARFPHVAIDSKHTREQRRQAACYLESVLWGMPLFHEYLNNCYAMFRKTRRFVELDIECKITRPFLPHDLIAMVITVSVNGFEIDGNGQANKIATLAQSGLKS